MSSKWRENENVVSITNLFPFYDEQQSKQLVIFTWIKKPSQYLFRLSHLNSYFSVTLNNACHPNLKKNDLEENLSSYESDE